MARNFDALKSPLLAYAMHNARFIPPMRWVTFSPPTSTLTNFPALVRARNFTKIANGYDVHFQDASGNELTFELDWYDNASKSGAWWVQIPTLSSSGPTSIKMLYGDAGMTEDLSDPLTLWSDYEIVYHFNKIPSGTMTNVAKGTNHTCRFSSPYFVDNDEGTGRSMVWTSTASAGSASNALTTTGVSIPSMDHTTTALIRDTGYTSEDIFMPIIMPATQDNKNILSSAEYYNHDSLFRHYSAGGFVRAGCYPHNVEMSFTVQKKLRYYNVRLDAGSFRSVRLDTTTDSGNKDGWSGREFNTSTTFYSFLSFWGGTIHPQVDELRLRGDVTSNAWTVYEYRNYIAHDTYTTYGDEE